MRLPRSSDYFWFDRGHWRIVLRFTLLRAGLGGGQGWRHLAQLALLPLTVAWLSLYAAQVHFRRWLRSV